MKKLVIFDLDGTLTDTLDSIEKSANLAIGDFGFAPIARDRYRYFVGNGAFELIRQCLAYHGCEDREVLEKVYAHYQEVFAVHCMYHVKPYDGILQLLQALREKQIKLAVNSNKPHPRTIRVVEDIFGKDFFDCIIGQSGERERKPAPDGVFAILDALSAQKQDTIYIGDTCTDMQTGKNAGVFTVGALWGFRDRQELEAYHADVIIAHPMELLNYLD